MDCLVHMPCTPGSCFLDQSMLHLRRGRDNGIGVRMEVQKLGSFPCSPRDTWGFRSKWRKSRFHRLSSVSAGTIMISKFADFEDVVAVVFAQTAFCVHHHYHCLCLLVVEERDMV